MRPCLCRRSWLRPLLPSLWPDAWSVRLFAHEQYLQVRKELVDYIAQTADRLKLENDTVRLAAGRRSLALCARVASVAAAHLMHAQVHLAAALMDRVRAAVFVQNGPRLLLTGIACLIISTKFTETSQEPEGYCLIPSNTHFLAAMNAPPAVTARILTTYERCILHILSWRIRSATPANFADAFRALGLFLSTDTTPAAVPPSPTEQEHVWKLVRFFCDLATLRGYGHTFGVAVSAAASIAAARLAGGVHPAYPEELATRFGLSLLEITPCLTETITRYRGDLCVCACVCRFVLLCLPRFSLPTGDPVVFH